MTVSTTTSSVSYSANGSQTIFPYTFKIFEDSDLLVILRNDATNVETTQALTTDYTVTNAGNDLGGDVVFLSAPAAGNTVFIRRSLPITQLTDYVENDPFPAESHEDALDKLTMITQQVSEESGRAIKIPESVAINTTVPVSATRANKLLGFSAGGDVALSNSTITQVDAAVSSFVNATGNNASSILYDPDGSGAQQTTVQAKLREQVSVFDFMSPSEVAAAQAGVTPPDITTALNNAIDASQNVYIPAGTYKISEVEIPRTIVLEGAGTYQTLIYVEKAGVGTNRGLFCRLNTEGESGMIIKQLSLEAENYLSVGKHSYGLNIANVAHAYVESVHCVGFEIGFFIEDSLINTFMRCRAHQNKWGVYILGTEPLSGGDGASKNLFIDLKATVNGDSVNSGAAILITGNSAYQNTFINPDLEGNWLAISIDVTAEAPNVFINPYFEAFAATGSNGQNLIRCQSGKNLIMNNPTFGTAGLPNTYFDTNFYGGTVDLIQASSNTQGQRIPPPQEGRMELITDNAHNIASTNIMSMARYRQTFTPTMQGGGVIAGSNIASYIYGSTASSGASLLNTFGSNPNDPTNWTSGTGTTGQTDPLGGTTAVRTNGNLQIKRSLGSSTGKVVAQCFVKVVDTGYSEFQLVYKNNDIVRKRQVYAYSQPTDWMLLYVEFDLTGEASTSAAHELAIEDVGTKIIIWWPQIVQGTDQPQPILPLNEAAFSTSLRKVGATSYELPQIVDRVSFSGATGTAASFTTLVDSTSPAKGRVFDLIIREAIGADITVTTYRVSLAYADETTSADSIVLISTHEMGSTGYSTRITPTVSSLTASSNKTITLTTTDFSSVDATIREIT